MYRPAWPRLGGLGSVINLKFVASDDFAHSYPHSGRSKAKVIFRCTPQWFIPMDQHHGGETVAAPQLATDGGVAALGFAAGSAPALRGIALGSVERTRW